MRRFFAILICAMLALSLPIVVFAEGDAEVVTEDAGHIATEEPNEDITDTILAFVKEHFADVSVMGSLLLAALYKRIKDKAIHKAIGTLNNNAVTVAENSNASIQMALSVLTECKVAIESLMSEFRVNAEDKEKLEKALAEAQAYLKTAKLANVELANELAELLILANIPNSKKEELYSRHLAAVNAIADAEKTEVIADDGQETE